MDGENYDFVLICNQIFAITQISIENYEKYSNKKNM